MSTRIVEIRAGVLRQNDEIARTLRTAFEASGTFVTNLVSSPGSGKTTFLQQTLTELRRKGMRVAALVGDLETDNDARRLAASGAPVKQINTHGRCHLEAAMIREHLESFDLGLLDYLFVENVGNLVCPASYDLGEALRVVLLSVTEGEDKPLKYPSMFNSADMAVFTKIDLAEACEFDRAVAVGSVRDVRPAMPILEVSAKRGVGMAQWIEQLQARRELWRGAHPERRVAGGT